MTWAVSACGVVHTASGLVTQLQIVSSLSFAAGDTALIAVTQDRTSGAEKCSVTDSLSTPYSVPSGVIADDAINGQALSLAGGIVASAGTPTVTVKWNPTPGTTTAAFITMNLCKATGSDASSVLNGAGAGALIGSPGAGTTDGVTSNAFTTTVDGCLIFAASVPSYAVNTTDLTAGSGFTLAQVGGQVDVVCYTEYKTQTTQGSVAGTFTSSVNNAHITVVLAVTPAAGGGGSGGPPLDPEDVFQMMMPAPWVAAPLRVSL